MRAARAATAFFFAAACAATLRADGPARMANARLEVRSGAGGLGGAFAVPAPSPGWFGYAVPTTEGRRTRTSSDDMGQWGNRCTLEGSGPSVVNVSDQEPERSGRLLLFFRMEGGRPRRLRVFTDDCVIDAGGMPVIWLEGVRPADSVAWLARFDGGRESDHEGSEISRDRAIMAIALHDDPSADVALERFASSAFPAETRKKTVFWLGNARGVRGWEILARLAQDDPSDDVRKQVTFALSQSPVPQALSTLISVSRHDSSAHVRSQALFWLAHKAGDKAAVAITDAISDDPETEVKKKAVFALTQLPSEESVTQLIRVAKTNRNAEVRKQAFFWLGQSKDPRAMACIEEILTK